MNDKDHYLEENISQLIRVGFGAEVRPSPHRKESAYRLLATQHRAAPVPAAFPESVLVLLTGILAIIALCLATQIVGTGIPGTTDFMFVATALPLALNLICVPIAGIVIVTRRR